MDRVHAITSIIAEDDRISKLPDDIIYRILGFLDMKYVVQTSKLSRKWRHIWTSLPYLNLNGYGFRSGRQFSDFVKRVLSQRNNRAKVSTVELIFTRQSIPYDVKRVVMYAYSHDVRQLTMSWFGRIVREFPHCVFSSHTLKHLTLTYINNGPAFDKNKLPRSAWDFPALETLNLTRLQFGPFGEGKDKNLNLFSKCVKLKDLILDCCNMSGADIFKICAPQLLNLTVTGCEGFPKVFNVVAPQLENLTASVMPPYDFLQLSSEDSLKKVNLSSSLYIKIGKSCIPPLLGLFKKLHSAKVLILDVWITEALALIMDQVSHEPCPFNNLKCLKIDMEPVSFNIDLRDRIAKIAPQVRNYFLENSSNATFVMDLPQVPPTGLKRRIQEVNNNTMANKVAKFDVPTFEPSSASRPSSSDAINLLLLKVPHQISTQQVHNDVKKMANLDSVVKQAETIPEDTIILKEKIQMQDQLKQKAMFEAKMQKQDEINAKQKTVFEAKIQKHDEVIAKQKATFEAKIQMQDQLIAEQKAMFEEKIQKQDEVTAKQKTVFKAKIQVQDEVIAKQKATFEAKIQMQDKVIANQKKKVQMQDEVIAKQKATFEAKVHMQDEVIAKQKATFDDVITKQKSAFEAKIQMQDEVIAKQKAMLEAKTQMVEAAKLQHEKLMSLIIKSKIAELKVKIESGFPSHEVIHSMCVEIGSAMDLIPESLRVKLEARFSLMYEGFKSLLLTHFDDSQWEKIESQLVKEYIRDS